MADVTYEADSLEDIAAMFDDMAERAAKTATRATTKVETRVNNAESRTWTRAAELLRRTTLKRAEPSDREVSIGKHAFDAGYNSAAQRAVDFAPTVIRDWAAHREAAWSDYTPPEFD